jgi:nucleoside phosphorylase
MGAVVCPDTWMIEGQSAARVSEALLIPLRARGWQIAGSGLTVSLPVLRATSRLELFEKTGAQICDMEAGTALQVAESLGIPALAAKVVSDSGDCSFLDFYRNLNKNLQLLGTYLQSLVRDLEEIAAVDQTSEPGTQGT